MAERKISVVLIDNELRAINRLKLLLKNFNQVEIIGEFEDGFEGLQFIKLKHPDVAMVDIEMPGITGLELVSEINKTGLFTKIIFVTAYEHYAIDAIRHHAFDYLNKPVTIQKLKDTFKRIEFCVNAELTKRELEIIRLLGKGLESKEIGEQLFISKHTVDTYRRKILNKTGAKNTAELVYLYSTNRII